MERLIVRSGVPGCKAWLPDSEFTETDVSVVCSGACLALSAASAAALPGRLCATQSSILRCEPADTASAPGGTSLRTTVPAPVYAPSPTVTGATNMVSDPVRTWEPMVVRRLDVPS